MAFNNPFPNYIDIGYSDNDFDYNFILNNVQQLATQTGIHTVNFVQNDQYTSKTISFTAGDPFIFPKQWFLLYGIIIFEIVQPDTTKIQFTFDSVVFEQFRIQKVKEVPFFFGNQKFGGLASEYTLLEVLAAIGGGGPMPTGYNLEVTQLLVKGVLDNILTQANLLGTEVTLQAIETAINSLPAGGDATAANQVLEIAELTALNLKDFSTETTLQLVLAQLLLSGQEITLQSILTALGPLATEVTLGQVLIELQNVNTALGTISTDLNSTIYTVLSNILTSNQQSEIYLSGIGSLALDSTLQALSNYILTVFDVQLSTRASESTLQSVLTQLDIPLSLLQADIQNVNASLATTNNYLANIDLSTQSVATKLAEPTNSLILPITPTTALNNGSESLIIGAANKKTVLIANGTNRTIYVAYGATANTTNNYSFRILANTFERIEIGANLDFSYSIVQNTATGTINITELN